MEKQTDLIELSSSTTISIGVVADTHVPDRVKDIHPGLLSELKRHELDYIFHCGDLSRRSVLESLKTISPVYAVRGNRDLLLRKELPPFRIFVINGVRTLLTHGYLTPLTYWTDKIRNLLWKYELSRYVTRLENFDHAANIHIFGHSHHSENSLVNGKLFFNPGGCSVGCPPDFNLSYGVIKIDKDGKVESEIFPLMGAVVKFRKWDLGDFSRLGSPTIS